MDNWTSSVACLLLVPENLSDLVNTSKELKKHRRKMWKQLFLLFAVVAIAAKGFSHGTSPKLFARRQQPHMTSTALSPTSPAPARRKGEVVEGPIQWEDRSVAVEVPNIEAVEAKARRCEHTTSSKQFCRKSGGYPDLEIKKDIYTLLWASSVQALKVESGYNQ